MNIKSVSGQRVRRIRQHCSALIASLPVIVLTMVLLGGLATSSLAQETKAADTPAEPAKVEAPAAAGAEVKKEDPGAAPAQFTQGLMEQIGGAKVAMDTMWTLIAGMLVFFMNLGFATVESGFAGRKTR